MAESDRYEVAQDGRLVVEVPGVLGNDLDPDGDELTALLVSGPGHGTLELGAHGGFVYERAAGFVGIDGEHNPSIPGEACEMQ